MKSLKSYIRNLSDFFVRRLYYTPRRQKSITDAFHKMFYYFNKRTWDNTYWLGAHVLKCPFDLWIYQEIINKVRPDIIIETGTFDGGSAFFLASICDFIGKGKIITIDIDVKKDRPRHNRITYLSGSSTSESIINTVKGAISNNDKVLVILDSDHTKEHVLNELRIYNKFVTNGSYIIVEDTNVHGHPVDKAHPAGPMEALKDFLKENSNFVIDEAQEKFYLTFNPSGHLLRIK